MSSRCCGAINSAALLAVSANDKHPHGLANNNDVVGRHFMFHQADAILAIGKEPNRSSYMKTFSLNDFYFGDKDYPFPMGNISARGLFSLGNDEGRRAAADASIRAQLHGHARGSVVAAPGTRH